LSRSDLAEHCKCEDQQVGGEEFHKQLRQSG
jgi:hypothetical protein